MKSWMPELKPYQKEIFDSDKPFDFRMIHAPTRNHYTDDVLQQMADTMRVVIVNRTPKGDKVFKPKTT